MLAIAVVAPSLAAGSTLKITGSQVDYDAVAGETNQLTVVRSGDNYVFTEAGAVVITAMAPCLNVNASVGTCPAAGIGDIDAALLDMNDTASYDQSIGSPIDEVEFDGGDGNDTLTAQGSTDAYFLGRDGNDVLTGAEGDDDIRAMNGNDTVQGGPGDDFLPDGDGNDTVQGDAGRDRFNGGSAANGTDLLDGGPGLGDSMDARSRTEPQIFNLNGQADDGEAGENDNLVGIEQIDSGEGDDTLIGGAEPNDFRGNGGNDTMDGGAGPDRLDGYTGEDSLDGGEGDDELWGGPGADQEQGGPGQDLFNSEFFDDGSDSYMGGPGSDSIINDDYLGRPVKVSLDGVADDGSIEPVPGTPMDNAGVDLENFLQPPVGQAREIGIGLAADDILSGNGSANRLEGGSGNDRIDGMGGPDSLIGGPGDDDLDAGNGIDEILGEGGNDSMRSRDGSPDDVDCGSGSDILLADSRDDFSVTCDSSSTGPRMKSANARLNRKGKAEVTVSCPAAEGIACKVKLKVKKGKKTVAKGGGTVKSGKSARLGLKLTKKGRKLNGKKIGAKATTLMTDAAGSRVSTTRKLVLKR